VFENRMLEKTFGSKGAEGRGVWREFHNEELLNFY
jgi:hypothetical protein